MLNKYYTTNDGVKGVEFLFEHAIPQARPRVFVQNGTARAYNPQSSKKKIAQSELRRQYGSNEVLTGLVGIKFEFGIGGLRSGHDGRDMHHRACKPDIDNLIKFYMDVLTGIVYNDDSCVVKVEANKFYSQKRYTKIVLTKL